MSGVKVLALGRFEWERVIRRIVVPTSRRSVKVVAMMLATYADADGRNVRPGEQRLSAVTQLGRSTVRESLSWLRDSMLLYRQSRGSNLGRANLVDIYQLCAPEDWQERFLILSESEIDDEELIRKPKRRNNNPLMDFD